MEPTLDRFPWLESLLPFIGYIFLTVFLIFAYHFIANQVKQIFILRTQKKQLFDDLYMKVEKLLDKVKDIVESLSEHKKDLNCIQDDFKTQLAQNKKEQSLLILQKVRPIQSELSELKEKEKEHFRALKGSYDKQFEKIKDLESEIAIIKNTHNHHHPENKI